MKRLLITLLFAFGLAVYAVGPDMNSGAPDPVTSVQRPPAPVSVPVLGPSMTTVATPSAPPSWAQDLMVAAESLPLIGPVVSKILLWTGIVGSILTALVTTMTAVINLLKGVLNFSGFSVVSSALAAFQNGKIMYWLKFFSFFNAKKPEGSTGKAMTVEPLPKV